MTRDQEQVRAVRDAGFAKYDKALHSKCKRPDLYGICRVKEAEQAIAAQKPKTPRKDNRKKSIRVQGRLSKKENTLLQQAFTASCHKTMQDFVSAALMAYALSILDKEKTATDAGTSEAVKDDDTTSLADKGGEVK